MPIFGQTTDHAKTILQRLADTFFNTRSITVLVISVLAAVIAGRLIAYFLRRLVNAIGRRADHAKNVNTVNRLRRYETILILSIALIKVLLAMAALYFWWVFTHPTQQPTAIIGASALFAIIAGGVIGPVLRDFAFGSVMMAEQWYGVGDHIKVEPFADMQGVVERVTLRSTRIRALTGEIIWVSNQNIAGVRITPKGIRTISIELFVTDLVRGEGLLAKVNDRLPQGPLLVVSPLTIVTNNQVGPHLWHITTVGETAPGREWMLEKMAVQIMQELDGKSKAPVLASEPVSRYADSDAERKFTRTIANARKPAAARRKRNYARTLKTIEKKAKTKV